ncbi:LPXTG cell wall anchor domain-containing protein [endosymbiont of unidentified scaly snail isolate Monju]|uniref:LPXTG cell wall anchor domain-containing protein n=1 Tax=endosymbiont of unidentified scaly snail isolate Monju TaxID=1248727 RepID=UPI0005BE7123|nr:LPXTG cell wall anchor domain-containing protein [endosymbiont of unidentified scaly snail isolate Monju]
MADSPEPETPDTIPPAPAAGDHRAAYWGLAGVLGLALLGWLVWRRKRSETGTAALDIPLAAHPEVLNRGPRPYENVRDHPPEDDHEHASDVSDQEVAFSSPRVQGDQDSENMQPHTVQPNEELDIAPPPSRVELHELDSELLPTPAGLDLEDDSTQQELIGLWEHVDTLDLNEADSSLIDESATLSELNEEEDQSLEIVLEMARAYVELGDREEATAILQKALSSADSEEKRARIQSVLEEIA